MIVSGAAFKRAKQPLRLRIQAGRRTPAASISTFTHTSTEKNWREVRCNLLDKEQRRQQGRRWQTMQSTVADGSVQTAPNGSEKNDSSFQGGSAAFRAEFCRCTQNTNRGNRLSTATGKRKREVELQMCSAVWVI